MNANNHSTSGRTASAATNESSASSTLHRIFLQLVQPCEADPKASVDKAWMLSIFLKAFLVVTALVLSKWMASFLYFMFLLTLEFCIDHSWSDLAFSSYSSEKLSAFDEFRSKLSVFICVIIICLMEYLHALRHGSCRYLYLAPVVNQLLYWIFPRVIGSHVSTKHYFICCLQQLSN